MTVVKYFHEEPAGLEILAPDTRSDGRAAAEPRSLESFLAGPSYFRGYLAATDLETGRTGASAIRDVAAWSAPLTEAIAADGWWTQTESGGWAAAEPDDVLLNAPPGTILVTGPQAPPDRAVLAKGDGGLRRSLDALRELLDSGYTVLVAEPAPDGVDWALFDVEPLAVRLRSSFAGSPVPGVRRFVIPLREARAEHRFYFERYDLSLYAAHEID